MLAVRDCRQNARTSDQYGLRARCHKTEEQSLIGSNRDLVVCRSIDAAVRPSHRRRLAGTQDERPFG